MPVVHECPSCDKKIKVPDGAEGKKLKCPSCQTALLITEDGLELAQKQAVQSASARSSRKAPVDDDEDEAPKAKKRRGDDDEDDDEPRAKKSRGDDNEDEEVRPSRKRKKSGAGMPMWVWLAGGGGLLVVVLLVLFLFVFSGGGAAANYDAVKLGMTEAEVEKLLGKPTTSGGIAGFKTAAWVSGKETIQITYEKGKVVNKTKVGLGKMDGNLDGMKIEF